MPIAFGGLIDTFESAGVSGNTLVFNVGPGGVPAGSLIVVGGAWDGNRAFSSIADTAGNTYNIDQSVASPPSAIANTYLFSAPNASALVQGNTITITVASTGNNGQGVAFYLTGAPATTPKDQSTSGQAQNNTTPNSGNTTPLENNEMLIGLASRTSGGTAFVEDATFTNIAEVAQSNNISLGVIMGRLLQTTAAADAYVPTITSATANTDWAAIIASYKASAVTGLLAHAQRRRR